VSAADRCYSEAALTCYIGTGAVYSFDPVGSYEREACRAAGAASSLVQPFLDNQVGCVHLLNAGVMTHPFRFTSKTKHLKLALLRSSLETSHFQPSSASLSTHLHLPPNVISRSETGWRCTWS
jgi:hypothetical protein